MTQVSKHSVVDSSECVGPSDFAAQETIPGDAGDNGPSMPASIVVGGLHLPLTFEAAKGVFDTMAAHDEHAVRFLAANSQTLHTQLGLQAVLWRWRADPAVALTLDGIARGIELACEMQLSMAWKMDGRFAELFEPVPTLPGRKPPVRSVRIAAPPPPIKLGVKEAALRMRCGVDSIRSRFRKLPGVEVEYRPEVLGAHRKRAYTTMFIPLGVMEREERRLGTR